VPYPYAWRYQRTNAAYLVEREAAVLLPDEELSQRLLPVVLEIMHADDRRKRMGQAMSAMAQPAAASRIAEIISDLAIKAAREGKPTWSV
jgi:UDP-N-acetylglucosamine--N-acetylmuramyl-(pentapeptide) pyrophosphoryl-undecaprenol N-acetylglucosamine transferase